MIPMNIFKDSTAVCSQLNFQLLHFPIGSYWCFFILEYFFSHVGS